MWFDLGPCIRRLALPAQDKRVFLTFDDGPDVSVTPRVLDMLDRHGVKASFFVIAAKARMHADLVREIVARGHCIGNHSDDHNTWRFFSRKRALRRWVDAAEGSIQAISGLPSIGFRSPVGIQTPPLHAALKELAMPMILWNRRYYDTVVPWTLSRAENAARQLEAGDIVLLHDRGGSASTQTLIPSLDIFLKTLAERGFLASALRKEEVCMSLTTGSLFSPVQSASQMRTL